MDYNLEEHSAKLPKVSLKIRKLSHYLKIIKLKIKNCIRMKSFTLVELLVYVALFAIVGGLITAVLYNVTVSSQQNTASNVVVQELQFVQNRIQTLVREASLIENEPGESSHTLTLRMLDSEKDPTVISSGPSFDCDYIYLKQGENATTTLNSDKVKVSDFTVTKYENPGGKAVVKVNISLTYNSTSKFKQVTRSLTTAIGKVSAATFDSNLIPNTGDTYSVGISPNQMWSTGVFNNLILSKESADSSILFKTDDTSRAILGIDYSDSNKFKIEYSDTLGGTTPALTITSANRVGIGTDSPSTLFEVYATSTGMLVVDSAGNVGIGTTGPDRILDVENSSGDVEVSFVSSITGTTRLLLGDTEADYAGRVEYDNSAEALRFWTTGTEKVTIDTDGNVGIGTTEPREELEISSAIPRIFWNETDAGADAKLWGLGTSQQGNFVLDAVNDANSDGKAAMIIERSGFTPTIVSFPNGNVGIGTTEPGSYKLKVNGEIAYVSDSIERRVHNVGGEGGASSPSVGLSGWTAGGGTNLPHNTWVNTQYVTLPTGGVYLIISNYRIYGTNVAAFVKARLRWTDSASRETEHRMVVERVRPIGDNFINYGGSVSWVINVDQDNKTIYADYFRYGGSADNEYYWQNDGNGVPRVIAVRLY